MARHGRRAVAAAFAAVLVLLGTAAYAQHAGTRVLVLFSYHKGLLWNDNVAAGIEEGFGLRMESVDLHYEFMDTKRHVGDEYFAQLAGLYRRKYRDFPPRVIIASDNNAFNFLLRYRDELFPGVPVVFCGLNHFSESMIEGQKSITGVVEQIDFESTLRTALRLTAKVRRVVIVNDRTETGKANKKTIMPIIEKYRDRVEFAFFENYAMEELKERISQLPGGTVVILLVYTRDARGRFFSFRQSIAEISSVCRVPMYGVWGFYLGRGIVGGMLTTGRMQGLTAARMALRILDGERAANIPVVRRSPNVYMFDWNQMQRFGIYTTDLPEGSRVINMPVSLYEAHRELVWAAIVIFMALLITVAALVSYILLRRRIEDELRKSRARLRKVIDTVPHPIFARSAKGRFVVANRALASLYGRDVKDVVGQLVGDVHPVEEEVRQMLRDDLETIRANRSQFFPVREVTFPEKGARLLQVHKIPFELNEGEVGVLTVGIDITPLKKVESRLQELNQELEDRVRKRTRELEEANRALQESLNQLVTAQKRLVEADKMAALGGLVAGVAHEINTPVGIGVTAITYFHDQTEEFAAKYREGTLTRSGFESYISTAREACSTILVNLNRAAELVRSFKQVAVDQASEEKRRFRMKQYIEEVLLSLKPKFKHTSHSITVDCPEDLEIFAPPGVFTQIITNFLMNSLLHGFEGIKEGHVEMRVSLEGEDLLFVYSDDGKGMDEEQQKHIFEPFFTTRRAQGGTGLGLHIVYNLVTQTLRGEVRCETAPGKGATFRIRVPLSQLAGEG